MNKPRSFVLPREKSQWGGEWSDGIEVVFIKSTNEIRISGWYDGCVGIEGERMPLKEFFGLLGITEAECHKAFKEI